MFEKKRRWKTFERKKGNVILYMIVQIPENTTVLLFKPIIARERNHTARVCTQTNIFLKLHRQLTAHIAVTILIIVPFEVTQKCDDSFTEG